MTIGGTFDVLTNAIVPDPSGKIVISGPLFSEIGKYNVDVEVTTVDNDKQICRFLWFIILLQIALVTAVYQINILQNGPY